MDVAFLIFCFILVSIVIVELMDVKDAYVDYLRAKAEYYRRKRGEKHA